MTEKTLPRGETAVRNCGNVLVAAWTDKKTFRVVSTLHEATMVGALGRSRGQAVQVWEEKPLCVREYNAHMGGVDKLDQMISYYPLTRKTCKWTKKMVFYWFEIAIHNAFVIYKWRYPNGQYRTLLRFRKRLITSWADPSFPRRRISVEVAVGGQGGQAAAEGEEGEAVGEDEQQAGQEDAGDEEEWEEVGAQRAQFRPAREDHPARLNGDRQAHLLVKLKQFGRKRNPTRVCRVCTRRGMKKLCTSYMCPLCLVPLHTGQCDTDYHTLREYF